MTDHAPTTGERLAAIETQLDGVISTQKEFKDLLEKYVTHVEFSPVKLIAFGMVSVLLASILVAIIGAVFSAAS